MLSIVHFFKAKHRITRNNSTVLGKMSLLERVDGGNDDGDDSVYDAICSDDNMRFVYITYSGVYCHQLYPNSKSSWHTFAFVALVRHRHCHCHH